MAKDAKKKRVDKKARVAQKEEKKATQKEKKQSKKSKDDDSDADDADIDSILAEYQKQQEQFLKVTEVASEPPSPRKNDHLVSRMTFANQHRCNRIFCYVTCFAKQQPRALPVRGRIL